MRKLIYTIRAFIKERNHNIDIQNNSKYAINRLEAEIVRNVHSIEKGLSIENPRLGFGIAKMNEMFSLVDEYVKLTDNKEVLYFVVDAVDAYIRYHEAKDFDNKDVLNVKTKCQKLKENMDSHEGVSGGTIIYGRQDDSIDIDNVRLLFNTRHSIREFSEKKVPEETIIEAIKLAQRSPSACNRQAVRVYSIDGKDYLESMGNLEGIGGFAQDVDKFLLITGVQSAYRPGEKNQFIVSASMFAGYLTLSLHALGVASCVVQRNLYADKLYNNFRKKYCIAEDEQLVVMIGIGMPKEETVVPVSKRLSVNKIYRNLSQNQDLSR